MTSISGRTSCSAQKSSISWVSAMPPIIEPERLRRLPTTSGEAGTAIGVLGHAELDQRAVDGQQAQVGVQVEVGRNGVDDQVERPAELREGLGVAGRVVVVGAEPQTVLHLLQRLAQHRHLGAHRVRRA